MTEHRSTHSGVAGAAPALSVLGLSAAAALALESRAGAAMFGASFAAIAGAALLGWPRRSVTVVGFGVAGIVWLVVVEAIGQPGVRSAIAHAIAGALLGWALADGILRAPGARAGARRVLAAAVLATLAVGVIWELWEWATDELTGTDLTGGIGDTIADLIADGAGAAAGAALAVSSFGAPSARRPCASPESDSNRRPPPYHGGALPTELSGREGHDSAAASVDTKPSTSSSVVSQEHMSRIVPADSSQT